MTTFDYTSRDYYSIKEDLFNRAAQLPLGNEWTTRSSSDFGVMLVDLWAYMGDVLHFYVDRAAAEAYIGTATQRESVLALANLLDYEPTPLGSATAQVTIQPTTTLTSPITIPAFTSFVAPARSVSEETVYFSTTQSASMSTSASALTLSVVEGIVEQNEAPIHMIRSNGNVSTGVPNQQFSLRYTNVVPSSVEVFVYEGPVVNGQPTSVSYRYTSRLVDGSSADKVFTIAIASDGVVQVVFGNGVNGKVPNAGAEIYVTYRRSTGAAGNIASNRITQFATGTFNNLAVVSSTPGSGGYNAESIESLKANIPLLFRTQDRAVSLQDFKDLALRVPNVVKATANNNGSTVTIYPLGPQPDYLSTSFGSTITVSSTIATDTLEYFAPRSLVGASVTVASTVSLTNVYISASVTVQSGYVRRWVTDAVIATLDEFFEFDNVSFGQTLSLGQVYRAMMSVTGVDYINITVFNTSNAGFAAGNIITAPATSLLRKATDYTLTVSGGIVG